MFTRMRGLSILLWKRIRAILDEKGVTTAEYALLLALVVVVLIGSLTALGSTLQAKLQGIIDSLSGAP